MKQNIIITLLLLVNSVLAQDKTESYSFSLQQAIEHAIQHNYSAINDHTEILKRPNKKSGKLQPAVCRKLMRVLTTKTTLNCKNQSCRPSSSGEIRVNLPQSLSAPNTT